MGRREKPLDPAAGPVQRFAAELRELRRESGGATYRAMAQRAPYSAATLAEAAAGRKLPTLPVALAYAEACGGDRREWERRWRRASADVLARPAGADVAEAPYPGLRRFQPEDEKRFFGREQLTGDLVRLVGEGRFTAVVGASGSGKSSLLRAGLIPALRSGATGTRAAAIRVFTPGPHPVRTHAHLLVPASRASGEDTVVVVDQFEEAFTLCRDPEERTEFVDLLLEARRPRSRLRVVVAVRADFFGHCAGHRALADALRDATLLVGPMTPAELRRAIVRPATDAGLIVERALTARLVEEATGEPGGLPLMSHALLETWRRRRGRALTLAAYEAAGGIRGAIAQTAEDLYTRLDPARAAAARRVLLRLVNPGEGAPDTRRPTDRGELGADGPGRTAEGEVLERLARARLVTLDGSTVNLAHEALIGAWPRLRGWIEEDRRRLLVHRQLTEAAQAWRSLDRDAGALYRGARLAAARDRLGGTEADLTPLEREFLLASEAAENEEAEEARARARRLRRLSAVLSVLLVFCVAAVAATFQQYSIAREQRRVVTSHELAARADSMAGERPEAAMMLALAAFQWADVTETRSSLLGAYARYRADQFAGHTDTVAAMEFSPDGRTLATVGGDHGVKLWDIRTHGVAATLTGHTDRVNDLDFSPDGRTLATAGDDRSVKLWDARAHRAAATLTGHTGPVKTVVFSPDGRTLATGGGDAAVRLWDVAARRQTAVLSGHSGEVTTAAFSPDGRTLVTGGVDATLRMWDTASGRETATLAVMRSASTGHRSPVYDVAFSPDGRTLAAAGTETTRLWDTATYHYRKTAAVTGRREHAHRELAFGPGSRTLAITAADGTVRFWDTGSHRTTATITAGDEPAPYETALSPGGRLLAVADGEGRVQLWNTATRQRTAVLGAAAPFSRLAAFSPDGRTLATTGSADGTVDLWRTGTHRRTGTLAHGSDVYAAAFSPDGRTLATGAADGTVRLWEAASGRRRATLSGHTDGVTAIAFSPDGRTLATGADDAVRLWDVGTGRHGALLRRHTGRVNAVAFSPDGRNLATASADRTVRVWEVRGHRVRATLTGYGSPVTGAAFSPDGRLLATAAGGRVRLWDTASHRTAATLTGHPDGADHVAFSPDGRTLVTAGAGTIHLWDTASRGTAATLTTGGEVSAMALSPDGGTLATAGEEKRLWRIDTGDVAAEICRARRTHRWSELVSDLPAAPSCP
jgi:WD40 repeat protein/energy-coupling factor transporter ATP-binding protein EcfA2